MKNKVPIAPKPKRVDPVAKKPTPQRKKVAPEPPKITKKIEPAPAPPRVLSNEGIVVQRLLPSIDQLLPSSTWQAIREKKPWKEEAISLGTKDPKYVSYFVRIKQEIELIWAYPDIALQNGLQGKLVLEFTIVGDGAIEGPRLRRSSGFSILDQEAIRAVKAASPFPPIPLWIGRKRINIVASFEYYDNRLKYGLMSQ